MTSDNDIYVDFSGFGTFGTVGSRSATHGKSILLRNFVNCQRFFSF